MPLISSNFFSLSGVKEQQGVNRHVGKCARRGCSHLADEMIRSFSRRLNRGGRRQSDPALFLQVRGKSWGQLR